jgi:hypothetical protein
MPTIYACIPSHPSTFSSFTVYVCASSNRFLVEARRRGIVVSFEGEKFSPGQPEALQNFQHVLMSSGEIENDK